MRCMAFCPAQAVEASHLLGVVAYLAGAIPATALTTWLVARVPALAFLDGIAGRISVWIVGIIALGVLYPLFHRALRVGWVRRFFARATLTHYYRRYHEPETTLEDLA